MWNNLAQCNRKISVCALLLNPKAMLGLDKYIYNIINEIDYEKLTIV